MMTEFFVVMAHSRYSRYRHAAAYFQHRENAEKYVKDEDRQPDEWYLTIEEKEFSDEK